MISVLDDLADEELEAHSSIVLAYNVDLLVYDKLLRRRLSGAGAHNQIVLCDATPYRASLDGLDPHSKVGRDYSVTPVRVAGAFHPKAYLVLGRRRGRLLVGSGNASLGGLVRNAEVFGRFDFNAEDGEAPHPAFRQVVEIARSTADLLPTVRAQLDRAEGWTPWLREPPAKDERVVHVGGPAREPLFDLLRRRAVQHGLKRAIVVCSSFDRRLEAVRELAKLGDGGHETVVVVQPGRLRLDGAAVARLGDLVEWRQFVDPRPSRKNEPADAYAHAKLVILETQEADYLMFGSANLSRPAWLEGKNVELVVELPAEPPGTWVKRLGLQPSLKIDMRSELAAEQWVDEPDDRGAHALHLGGVEWTPGKGWFAAISGEWPATLRLALGSAPQRMLQTLELTPRERLGFAAAPSHIEGVRFAWLADDGGGVLSNAVALTWPDVARARLSGWFGSRVEEALLSMNHGELLGHVLFEFLRNVPDLGVMVVNHLRGASSARSAAETAEIADPDGERTQASFYAAAGSTSDELARVALGDRSDFELLASLVQPLRAGSTSPAASDDDEDDELNDPGLEEEAERRGLDAKGSGRGETSESARLPTAKRMRAAGRRFERRVNAAAHDLGRMLTESTASVVLPPTSLARQVWMTYIAAFVAGRPVETSDEEDQVVVEPDVLAHYVLRCAVVLAGDAEGGLLRLVDAAAWETREGRTLLEGLRFMAAACAWATAWFEAAYAPVERKFNSDEEEEYAEGIHDAIPLFVLARLLGVTRLRLEPQDFDAVASRLKAWDLVPDESIRGAYERARELADWLLGADDNAGDGPKATRAAVGSAVVVKRAGVAIVVASHGNVLHLAMLGRPNRPVVRFKSEIARAISCPEVGRVLLRPVAED